MDELDALIASTLQASLEERGESREDLARAMSQLGFEWTRNTATQVIIGRRRLSLLELAGICEVLGRTLSDFLDSNAELRLPSGDMIGVGPVLRGLTEAGGDWTRTMADKAFVDALRPEAQLLMTKETTYKAARRLRVDPATVEAAAQALWGHSLRAEREARVGPDVACSHIPATERALQARRGHTTRVLIAELMTYLAEQQ